MPLVLSVHLWAGKSREGEKVNFNENFLNFLSVDAPQHAHSDTSGVLLPFSEYKHGSSWQIPSEHHPKEKSSKLGASISKNQPTLLDKGMSLDYPCILN